MKKIPLLFNRTIGALAVTGSLLIALGLSAQDPAPAAPPAQPDQPTQPDRRGPDRGNRVDRPDRGNRGDQTDRGNAQGRGGFGGLGLDEKQMQLYREASEQNRDALTKLDEKLRVAQKELLQATIAEKYDEKTVTAKAEIVAKIQTEMTVLRAKALSTVAPTLKPEQREQLENSRMGAAMLSGGSMIGAGGFGGPGGQGGQGGGFRGRDGQGGQPGQPGGENTGDRTGGPRRRPGTN